MKPIIASEACLEAGLDFSEVFKWQYAATDRPEVSFPMDSFEVGTWTVFAGKGLPVARLQDQAGNPIGVLLGIGAGPSGLVSGRQVLETRSDSASFFQDIEQWVRSLAGRYTLFVTAGATIRVYCDAVVMNGCVYNPASPLLCLDRAVSQHPMYPATQVESGGKFSFFHTSDPDVRRCNPSCYLDLSDLSEHRFWPPDEAFSASAAELTGIYDQLQERTKFIVESVCAAFPVAVPVSGGQDSRLLLALAGSGIRKVDAFFTHIHNYAGRIDATIASDIARRLQVSHQVIDRRKTSTPADVIEDTIKGFRIACGYTAQPWREMEAGLLQDVPEGHVVMRGHQTDVLRAVFIDRPGRRPRNNPKWQIRRLKIVPYKQFDEQLYQRFLPLYQSWTEGVPPQARDHLVDLMFLEIYYGSTIGCTFPAVSHAYFMSPFNSRELIELCLKIPEGYRRRSAAVFDCIHRFNPALAEVPYDFEFTAKNGLDTLDKIYDLSRVKEATRPRLESTQSRYDTLLKRRKLTWADLD